MRRDKKQALKLRRDGKSYNQINQILSIPKSTLSYWFKDLVLSKKNKNKILSRARKLSVDALVKRNKKQTEFAREKAEIIRAEAKKEFFRLIDNKLFLTGVSLYWAEGYKRGSLGSKWKCVDFTNSDPEMIRVIMNFFLNVCEIDIERIRIQLMVHKNINKIKAVGFWSKTTGVSKKQFKKIFCKAGPSSKEKRNYQRLPYGTIHVRISDVKLFFRIIGWIDGLKEFLNTNR